MYISPSLTDKELNVHNSLSLSLSLSFEINLTESIDGLRSSVFLAQINNYSISKIW